MYDNTRVEVTEVFILLIEAMVRSEMYFNLTIIYDISMMGESTIIEFYSSFKEDAFLNLIKKSKDKCCY